MINFTLDELASFSQEERKVFNELLKKDQMIATPLELKPSDDAINNILGYNRAVSVRKTKTVEDLTIVLN